MKNFYQWLENNNQLQVIKAEITLNKNRLLFKTQQGSFDLGLSSQQVMDLTQKMGSMAVAQNPNGATPQAYQATQQAAGQQAAGQQGM